MNAIRPSALRVSCVLLAAIGCATALGQTRPSELLIVDRAVDRLERNVAAIQTWTGLATIAEGSHTWPVGTTTLPATLPEPTVTKTIDFAFGRDAGAVRNHIRALGPNPAIYPDGTKHVRGDLILDVMRRGDLLFAMDELDANAPPPERRTLMIKPRPPFKRMPFEFLDPIECFLDPTREGLAIRLSVLRQPFAGDATTRTHLTGKAIEENGQTIVEQASPYTTWRYTFDAAVGGCLTEVHADATKDEPISPVALIQIEYEQLGGAWVPKRWTQQTLGHLVGTGQPHTTLATITFDHNAVNGPMPPDELTYKALGLTPGDSVFDERSLKSERYRGTDLIPATRPVAGD